MKHQANTGTSNGHYPRNLQPVERLLIESVLPVDRPGYRAYRESIADMVVLAQGVRGNGHLVLGRSGSKVDVGSPLSGVIAHGAVETDRGEIVIAVREETEKQVNVELMMRSADELPVSFHELRRWTYSSWLPGEPSPQSTAPVREVMITHDCTLVLAPADKRIWLYDSVSGMNRLVPITTLYGELMAVEKIRDPEISLRPGRFFEDLANYSEESLRRAFQLYNTIHPMISEALQAGVLRPAHKRGIFAFLKSGLRHE